MAHKSDFVPADIGLQLTGLAESGRIIGTDLPEEDGEPASALESGQLKLSHGCRSDLWEQARAAIYFSTNQSPSAAANSIPPLNPRGSN